MRLIISYAFLEYPCECVYKYSFALPFMYQIGVHMHSHILKLTKNSIKKGQGKGCKCKHILGIGNTCQKTKPYVMGGSYEHKKVNGHLLRPSFKFEICQVEGPFSHLTVLVRLRFQFYHLLNPNLTLLILTNEFQFFSTFFS